MCNDKFIIEEWEREKLAELVEVTKRNYEEKEKLEREREIEEIKNQKEEIKNQKEEIKNEKEEIKKEKEEREKEYKEREKKIKSKEEEIKKEKSIEIVKNMLNEGFDTKIIAKLTNISEEEIINIKKVIKN